MPETAVARRRDGRPPVDWPGRPTTVRGLLAALAAVAGDVPEITAAYRTLARELAPPIGRRPVAGRRPPRITSTSTSPAVVQAAQLASELAGYAASIPAVIEALRAIQGAVRSPSAAAATPLYVPDHLVHQVVDAGTLAPAPADRYVYWPPDETDPAEGSSVPWWPAPSPVALDLGLPLQSCSPSLVDWRMPGPVAYAATLGLVDQRRADYGAASSALAASGATRSERAPIAAQAARYRAWHRQLSTISDDVAARWAARVQATRAALAVLLDQERSTMPTTTTGVIAQVAEQIRDRITQGQGGRIAAAQSEVAFGWSSDLPRTLISYVTTLQATTRHLDVLRATDSGDPTTPTAESGSKPDAVDFTSDDIDLQKWAGIGTLTTESANWVSNVEQAIAGVMIGRILRGIESALVTSLTADAGLAATGTTMPAAVLDAIAKISNAGGRAGVLALAATDWVTLMSESGSAGGYVNVGDAAAGPAPTWMGLNTVIIPGLVAGSALVIDPRSAIVYEAAGAPLFICDLTSQVRTNKIQLAIETWAAGYCANPGGVATVTVGP